MEVFLASKAVLFVASSIAIDIVEAVNCLTGANSRQQAHIALLGLSASLGQLLLYLLVLVLVSHLLLMANRRGI